MKYLLLAVFSLFSAIPGYSFAADKYGPLTATAAKVKVTRSAVVSILSISVLGLSSNQVTYIDIICKQ